MKLILMHREILGAPAGQCVDHIDHNGLNNTKKNLRLATIAENNRNRRKQNNNKSGFIGVTWATRNKKWEAKIRFNGKLIHLAFGNDLEALAKIRDDAAILLHGAFANTNRIT